MGNLEKVLPTLSVVAISLLRLIPAFNSLNANYNYLRLYNVSINLIINELKKTEQEYAPTKIQRRNIQTKNKNFIEINDLTFGYNLKQNISFIISTLYDFYYNHMKLPKNIYNCRSRWSGED